MISLAVVLGCLASLVLLLLAYLEWDLWTHPAPEPSIWDDQR